MDKKIVKAKGAPAPVGPYNQAVVIGNLVYTAGQIPLDPVSGQMVGANAGEQAQQVLKNLKAVLEAAGSSLPKVVKTTVFLKDLNDFNAMNEVYAKYFDAATAPAPVGPYNQAVVIGNLVYTAGQIPLDPVSGQTVGTNAGEQARQVLKNLKAVLEAAGSSLAKVVKTTVFLKDLNDFNAMNEVYAKYFDAATAPARSTIQVARLPKDSLVEIEAVATL